MPGGVIETAEVAPKAASPSSPADTAVFSNITNTPRCRGRPENIQYRQPPQFLRASEPRRPSTDSESQSRKTREEIGREQSKYARWKALVVVKQMRANSDMALVLPWISSPDPCSPTLNKAHHEQTLLPGFLASSSRRLAEVTPVLPVPCAHSTSVACENIPRKFGYLDIAAAPVDARRHLLELGSILRR
ncbi:MAG: hypothetical protein LQ344_005266 [Seirophora lacunosa]|nr:MAG: hypothetical protein LQ344_005266 [Seirophora lacunosa]